MSQKKNIKKNIYIYAIPIDLILIHDKPEKTIMAQSILKQCKMSWHFDRYHFLVIPKKRTWVIIVLVLYYIRLFYWSSKLSINITGNYISK